ncbi:hypothetical protein [Melittangium boletus]|uniref:Uncharacterized protein n=1 Tax=Melittangium boletus DSM 14713 TaxID=1294270 RepID=A0A250IDD3_9BACT|nr:hypothetical protein [Melittangium boletus]ATB29243.1 hypothetical protein MEBOL_002692 [Melittangium boletus DSM 14713]
MIYALTADTSHIEEEDVHDATLIDFKGAKDATFFHPGVDYQRECGAPEVIEFVGNLEHAARLDHLFTTPLDVLLISKRMVRVLESVRAFPHRLLPVTIYAEKIKHLVQDRTTGYRTWHQVQDATLRNDNFVILQLTESLDCLDRGRTLVEGVSFRQSGRDYLSAEEAEHLELRPPPGDFPPVFFVPELLFYCFSEEAKRACDQAGLKGLWWRPQR